MKNKTRNAYMDFLKGIAILAMVIGHLVSDVPQGDVLFNIIYSFHMPLLFFISAYIEEDNRRNYVGRERSMLLKRAIGLLLPYFSWSILYAFFQGGISFSMSMNIESWGAILWGYEGNGLWFLLVLFGLKVMHFFYWKICRVISKSALLKSILIICLLECIVVFLALVLRQSFIVNMLSYAIPYFFAVLIVDFEWVRKIVESEWMAAGVIPIYVAVFPFFSFYNAHWTTQVIRIGLSLCVIVICCKLREIWSLSGWNKAICYYGKYSLPIYLLHGFFMDGKVYLYGIDSALAVLLFSVVWTIVIALICVVIAKLVECSFWWAKILFGK